MVNIGPPAPAAKPKAKPKGRPRKDDRAVEIPKSLQGKFGEVSTLDETSVDVTVERPKIGEKTESDAWSLLPWIEWRKSEFYVKQGLVKTREASVIDSLRSFHMAVDTSTYPIELKATTDGRKHKVVANAENRGERRHPQGNFINPTVCIEAPGDYGKDFTSTCSASHCPLQFAA